MNIPIPEYRAKKIDSDEYVAGYYIPSDTKSCLIVYRDIVCIEHLVTEEKVDVRAIKCDPSTLAIHFADESSTQSEKVWYNMEEISSIIKDYENGKMETN